MMYDQFQDWLLENCPHDLELDDFIEYLACNYAIVIQHASKNSGTPQKELIRDLIHSMIPVPHLTS